MKLLHISDLHLGKRLGIYSLAAEQEAMLDWVYATLIDNRADVLLIAGDVYDRAVPPPEAVTMFDQFLARVHDCGIPVCIVSGNHDSAERLSFGAQLFRNADVYLSRPIREEVACVSLSDEYGKVTFWLIPFCRPAELRTEDENGIHTYTDALKAVIEALPLVPEERNVAVAHQFLTGSVRSDSETAMVGGLDNVDATVFQPFDYTALGHLHRRQTVLRENVCYSGSPLCYDFSEAEEEKGAVLVELGAKGDVRTEFLPYREPLSRLRTLRGSYDMLTAKSFWETYPRTDFLQIILTDDEEVPDAAAKLAVLYPRILTLRFENSRLSVETDGGNMDAGKARDALSPEMVFAAFFARQNERELTADEQKYIKSLLAEEREESNETM